MNEYYLSFRNVGFLTIPIQIVLLVLLYVMTVVVGYMGFLESGLLFGYPVAMSILFVPIYEEILFRGVILGVFMKKYSIWVSIFASSVLFGLWHLKNIFYLGVSDLSVQILYTGLVFGPVMAYITVKTRTIWLVVMLHYLNNLFSTHSWLIEQFL
ncbi:MAG: CPBP family intramembrane metalloprotease [Candidatus Gracilibacteria bacterium]|nr:CPBP family intramembrane metalloprotease [Candidatus Gracilibacteria bacterium]